jgi:hypothetical protein
MKVLAYFGMTDEWVRNWKTVVDGLDEERTSEPDKEQRFRRYSFTAYPRLLDMSCEADDWRR